MACAFQATTVGKFASLIRLREKDMDINPMITTYIIAVTDVANGILGKEGRRKNPWVFRDVLDLFLV